MSLIYATDVPCGRCPHPLSEHPPDSPCCDGCAGWVSTEAEIARLQLELGNVVAQCENALAACRLAREALDGCVAKPGHREAKKAAYVALAKVLGG